MSTEKRINLKAEKQIKWGWAGVLLMPLAVVAFALVSVIIGMSTTDYASADSLFAAGGIFQQISNTLIFLMGAAGVFSFPVGVVLLIKGYSNRNTAESEEAKPENKGEAPKGWNWGAFFLPPIWSIGNNVTVGLLGFIPILNFVMSFYLGARGNELAWSSKNWESEEHFKSVQKKWAIWGLILTILFIFIQLSTGSDTSTY